MLVFGLSIFHQTKQKKHLSLGDFYKFFKYLAGETQQQSDIEMGRAPCCDKANVKKGPWSPEEDTKLKAYIDKYGTGGNWIALPQKIGLKRCGKSCRLRWLNYLRPNIKHGGFSEEEDNIICSLYISIGSRWSIIAAQLPGRTDNDIKNYWNTRLKKKLLGKRKQSNRLSSTSQLDSKNEFDNSYSQALSNSAFERLQLHMQLQSLQSPFSIYNSPSVFPKLHPLQEKMIHQTLRCSNENPRSLMQQVLTSPQSLLDQQKAQFYEPTTTLQEQQEEYPNPKMDELENSFNGISTSDSSIGFTTGSNCNLFVGHKPDSIHEQLNGGTQSASTFQAELESFLNNKSACGFVPQDQDQIAEFDCFKEVDGAKDIMLWWPSSNDFDSKSASLNSWDSASVLQSEMFQDYALGYNM